MTTTDAPAPQDATEARRRRTRLRDFGIIVAFALIFVGLALSTDTFLTTRNMVNLADQAAVLGIIACAAALFITSGNFDLSTSAVAAMSAIVTVTVTESAGLALGLAAGIGCGVALGLINGLVVAFAGINSFIATLASSIVIRGLAVVVTGGQIVRTTSDGFRVLARPTALGNVTMRSWVFLLVAVVLGLLLSRTVFGRTVYAVGGNAEAARLSGISTRSVTVSVFAISGVCAAIAGILVAARTGDAQASMLTGMELTAIAAAVVGGTSIMGGEGAIWRGVLGVLVLGLISNGFNLLGIDSTYQQVVQGVLILIAVGVDQVMRRRQR